MPDTAGRRLYETGCARCHGVDGRGVAPERVAFDVPVPDFTECSFSSREPDADWAAVVRAGGPVRAFDSTMPAFEEAFSAEEVQAILDYVRGFCGSRSWPRGELNLPRPLFTEKAYPEDEAVATAGIDLEGDGASSTVLVYEKRFGPSTQLEVEVPLGFRQASPGGGTATGVQDVAVAVKQVVWHSLERGAILSVGGEVVLPTGDRDRGLGKGTTVFEPFLAFGKLFPADAFLHVLGKIEVPANRDRAESEAGWRAVLGKTITAGEFGRAWTPMLELMGSTELEGGNPAWDIVPQMQVTLNTRQHVMANLGVRVPLTDRDVRSTQFLIYILWDWFDGGFFDGW